MKIKIISSTLLCFGCLQVSSVSTPVLAQAHVHGEGALLIAQQDKQWQFEFVLPAADILGFEHQAETQAQKNRVVSLVDNIETRQNILLVPRSCELQQNDHSLEKLLSEKHDDHDPDHDHDHDGAGQHQASVRRSNATTGRKHAGRWNRPVRRCDR